MYHGTRRNQVAQFTQNMPQNVRNVIDEYMDPDIESEELEEVFNQDVANIIRGYMCDPRCTENYI